MIYYTHGFGGGRDESRKLLRAAIAQHTGDDALAAALAGKITEEGDFGKPVIPGFSHFSVSHSRGSWAVLIADRPCGLDIQYTRDCDISGITGRFYSPEEQEQVLSRETGEGMTDSFFRIWTRREAIVKALGFSVASTELPPATCNEVLLNGVICSIIDTVIPGADGLYAAACIAADEDPSVLETAELITHEERQ